MLLYILLYSDYDFTYCVGAFSSIKKARAHTRKTAYTYIRDIMNTRKNHGRTINYRALREHLMETLGFYQIRYMKLDAPNVCDEVYSVI